MKLRRSHRLEVFTEKSHDLLQDLDRCTVQSELSKYAGNEGVVRTESRRAVLIAFDRGEGLP